MAMKIKTNHPLAVAFSFLLGLIFTISLAADEVAQVSGAASLSVPAGTVATPSYKVASIGVAGDPFYVGAVFSVSGNVLTFETTIDSDGVPINPFVPKALAAGIAYLKAKINGSGNVTAITDETGTLLSNNNTESSGLDDANPPTITIDEPDTGDDVAIASLTMSGGKITGVSVTGVGNTGGSNYTTVPKVTVDCGKYIIRVTQSGSAYEGRFFLISSNTATTVTVDPSGLAKKLDGSDETVAEIFETDFEVEIIRASTLGEIFGTETPLVASGNAYNSDLIYLWDMASGYYKPFYHVSPGTTRKPKGWYNRLSRKKTPLNDTVILPDQGFIIARRTNSALNLSSDGSVLSTDQKMQLPEGGNQFVMNNPFGVDILFAELFSPTSIGAGNSKFKPATDASGDTGDNVFLLAGSTWTKYWYKSDVNVDITRVATASAKLDNPGPLGRGLVDADVSLDSGTVTGLASCDSSGNTGVDHNTSEYTKVTISGTAPAAGITITFHDIRGRRINEDGSMELDVNRTEVAVDHVDALKVRHHNKSYTVEASGAGFVVIKKRRSFNFDSSLGTPTWSTGEGGAGYGQNAKVYFMGGEGSGGEGTATVVDGKVTGITVTEPGGGYTYPPQVVIGGGGWRKEAAGELSQDGAIIGSDTGVLIVRVAGGGGVLTYLDAKNPIK
jgi:hypothetical protein